MVFFRKRNPLAANSSKRDLRKNLRLSEVPEPLVDKYSYEMLEELEVLYEECDEDGSGYISVTEMIRLLQYAGLNPVAHMLEDILLEVDRNHDGKVSFSEFIIIWDKYLQRCIQEISVLELAFSFFDQDGSEEISLNEFKEAMCAFGDPLSTHEVSDFFHLVDTNNDRSINMAEFLKLAYNQRGFLKRAIARHHDWSLKEKEREEARLEAEAQEVLEAQIRQAQRGRKRGAQPGSAVPTPPSGAPNGAAGGAHAVETSSFSTRWRQKIMDKIKRGEDLENDPMGIDDDEGVPSIDPNSAVNKCLSNPSIFRWCYARIEDDRPMPTLSFSRAKRNNKNGKSRGGSAANLEAGGMDQVAASRAALEARVAALRDARSKDERSLAAERDGSSVRGGTSAGPSSAPHQQQRGGDGGGDSPPVPSSAARISESHRVFSFGRLARGLERMGKGKGGSGGHKSVSIAQPGSAGSSAGAARASGPGDGNLSSHGQPRSILKGGKKKAKETLSDRALLREEAGEGGVRHRQFDTIAEGEGGGTENRGGGAGNHLPHLPPPSPSQAAVQQQQQQQQGDGRGDTPILPDIRGSGSSVGRGEPREAHPPPPTPPQPTPPASRQGSRNAAPVPVPPRPEGRGDREGGPLAHSSTRAPDRTNPLPPPSPSSTVLEPIDNFASNDSGQAAGPARPREPELRATSVAGNRSPQSQPADSPRATSSVAGPGLGPGSGPAAAAAFVSALLPHPPSAQRPGGAAAPRPGGPLPPLANRGEGSGSTSDARDAAASSTGLAGPGGLFLSDRDGASGGPGPPGPLDSAGASRRPSAAAPAANAGAAEVAIRPRSLHTSRYLGSETLDSSEGSPGGKPVLGPGR